MRCRCGCPGRGPDGIVRWLDSNEPRFCEYFAGALTVLCRAAGIRRSDRGLPRRRERLGPMVRTRTRTPGWRSTTGSGVVRHDQRPGRWRAPPAPGRSAGQQRWSARVDSLRISGTGGSSISTRAQLRMFDQVKTLTTESGQALQQRFDAWSQDVSLAAAAVGLGPGGAQRRHAAAALVAAVAGLRLLRWGWSRWRGWGGRTLPTRCARRPGAAAARAFGPGRHRRGRPAAPPRPARNLARARGVFRRARQKATGRREGRSWKFRRSWAGRAGAGSAAQCRPRAGGLSPAGYSMRKLTGFSGGRSVSASGSEDGVDDGGSERRRRDDALLALEDDGHGNAGFSGAKPTVQARSIRPFWAVPVWRRQSNRPREAAGAELVALLHAAEDGVVVGRESPIGVVCWGALESWRMVGRVSVSPARRRRRRMRPGGGDERVAWPCWRCRRGPRSFMLASFQAGSATRGFRVAGSSMPVGWPRRSSCLGGDESGPVKAVLVKKVAGRRSP